MSEDEIEVEHEHEIILEPMWKWQTNLIRIITWMWSQAWDCIENIKSAQVNMNYSEHEILLQQMWKWVKMKSNWSMYIHIIATIVRKKMTRETLEVCSDKRRRKRRKRRATATATTTATATATARYQGHQGHHSHQGHQCLQGHHGHQVHRVIRVIRVTQCQDEFRILSGRTQKLKVAKRCWKQWNEHNPMYIYHK